MAGTEEKQQDGLFSKALKIAAYPVATVMGMWTARVNVSDSAYDHVKRLGGLDGMENAGLDELKDMFNKGLRNIETGAGNAGLPEAVAQNRKKYFGLIETRKQGLNISSFMDEWKVIHRSQKQSAIINGLTVGAVSLGALLAVANVKAIHHAIFKNDKDDSSEPQR